MKWFSCLTIAAAALLATAVPSLAQEQPCQWNYQNIPAIGGVATATYCGNVIVKGSIVSNILVVQNVAALRALNIPVASSPSILLLGYFSPADDGGGQLYYDPSDTTSSDNGCDVFVAANGGRYKRASSVPLPVTDCGVLADGVTSDDTALQRAFNVGVPVVLPKNQTLYLPSNTGVTYDVSKVSIDGNGATLDFRGMTSGVALTLFSTAANSQAQADQIPLHPFSRINLRGPDKSTGVVGVAFTPQNFGSPFIPFEKFDHFTATGFSSVFDYGDGTFFISLENFTFQGDGVVNPGVLVTLTSTNDAGEKYVFNNGEVLNATGFIVDKVQNPNCDIYANEISVDGADVVFTGDNGTGVGTRGAACHMFFEGHVESLQGSLTPVWLATDGAFIWNGGMLIPNYTAGQTQPFCQSDGNAVNGGVVLSNLMISTSLNSEYFCGGTGPFQAEHTFNIGGVGMVPIVAQSNNLIENFTFPTTPLGNWNVVGTGVSYDNTTAPGGSPAGVGSIKMVTSAGNSSVSVTYPIKPGQGNSIDFYWKTTGLTASGATAFSEIDYLNSQGVVIGSFNPNTITTDVAAWTRIGPLANAGAGAAGLPPPGTASITFKLGVFGPTGATVWFGKPMLCLQ